MGTMGPGDRPRTVKVKAHVRTIKPRAPKPVAPTPTVVRQAKAQARGYASQGRSVQKVATVRNRATATRQHEVKDTKGAQDIQRADPARAARVLSQRIGKPVTLNQGTGRYEVKHARPVLADVHAPVDVYTGKDLPLSLRLHDALKRPQLASYQAPAVAALNFSTRPIHAIAGAENEQVKLIQRKGLGYALTHGNPAQRHAAAQGFSGKGQTLFSDVLKTGGVKSKLVRAVGGFALDTVADPLVPLSGGLGAVAVRAGERAAVSTAVRASRAGFGESAARSATREAARRGATAEEAAIAGADAKAAAVKGVANTASKRAAAAAPSGRGVAIKYAGMEIPGTRRGTAAVARGVGAAKKRVPAAEKFAAGVRTSVREVRPQIAPAGADRAQYEGARRAAADSRSAVNTADNRAHASGRALLKAVGPDHYERVVHAIETGKIGALKKTDPEMHVAATRYMSDVRHALKLRRQAGERIGEIGGSTSRLERPAPGAKGRLTAKTVKTRNAGPRNYVPHANEDLLKQGLGLDEKAAASMQKGGRTLGKEDSAKVRSGKTTIRELNAERAAKGLAPYSTNLPLVKVNYDRATNRVAAHSNFLRALADSGQQLTRGQARHGKGLDLKAGESVYRLGSTKAGVHGLHKVSDTEAEAFIHAKPISDGSQKGATAVAKGEAHNPGRYVVLNEKVEKNATASAQPSIAKDMPLVKHYDKLTGAWKTLATATPGFHIRNLIGDTHMGYMEQSAYQMPSNINTARKVLKRNRALRKEGETVRLAPSKSTETVKINGQHVPLDTIVADAHKHGIFNTGPVGRDVTDSLAVGKGEGAKKVKNGPVRRGARHINNVMQDREAAMRLATYVHGLKKGMKPQEAAALSKSVHIDYGDLTGFEREVGRRAAPFYTFAARSTPFHLKKLATNPGKFAQYGKIREETAKAGGFSDVNQQDKGSPEFQARQAHIVITIAGKKHAISWGDPAAQALNEVPDLSKPGKYLDELGQFAGSLINPIVKTPAELFANKSLFFRNDIESKHAPLVAAPSWVQHLPDSLKKKWGVIPDLVDKRTGKKVWGWRGKAGYVAGQVMPGPAGQVSDLFAGTNRRGQSGATKVISKFGVKVDPYDPISAEMGREYKKNDELYIARAKMNQRGIKGPSATPEYKKLNAAIKVSDMKLHKLSVQHKDVIPLKGNVKGARKSSKKASGGMPIFKGDSSSSGGMPIFR